MPPPVYDVMATDQSECFTTEYVFPECCWFTALNPLPHLSSAKIPVQALSWQDTHMIVYWPSLEGVAHGLRYLLMWLYYGRINYLFSMKITPNCSVTQSQSQFAFFTNIFISSSTESHQVTECFVCIDRQLKSAIAHLQ